MPNKSKVKNYLINHPISGFLDDIQPENVILDKISVNAHRPELNWVCPNGHRFKKSPNRVAQSYKRFGSINCEYCANKKAVEGVNDLQTLFPDVAKDWDYDLNNKSGDTPSTVLSKSSKKYWWHCNNGLPHSYYARVSDRTAHNSGCNVCDGRSVVEGFNDIDTICPEAKSEWSVKNKKPSSQVSVGEHTKYYWQCKNGHIVYQSPNQRIRNGKFSICPECQKSYHTSFPEKTVVFYLNQCFTDVKENYRIGRMELDIYVPSISVAIEYDGSIFHGTKKRNSDERKNKWCCEHKIQLIRLRERNCACINEDKQLTIDVSDNPTNEELTIGIKELFYLLNRKGYIHTDKVSIDVSKDEKEIVRLQQRFFHNNSLLAKQSYLLNLWDYDKNSTFLGITPEAIPLNYNRKVFWKCPKCGYSWEQSPNYQNYYHFGCPQCENRLPNKDFAEKFPDVAKEWDYEKNEGIPSDYSSGSGYCAFWICNNNKAHKWSAKISVRTHLHSGCPYCNHSKVFPGETSLKALYPQLIDSEWDYEKNTINPDLIFPSSRLRAWWKNSDNPQIIRDKVQNWKRKQKKKKRISSDQFTFLPS